MNDAFLSEPWTAKVLDPDIVAFLRANQPPAAANPAYQVGHWTGVAAALYRQTTELAQKLAHAQQCIRELEADA